MKGKNVRQSVFSGILIMLLIFYCTSSIGIKPADMKKEHPQMQPFHGWEKTYGGVGDDYCCSIHQTTDGGYILAGYTYSDTKKNDGWLVKIDGNGTITWEKKYGGYIDEYMYWAEQTIDGGYIASGKIFSYTYDSFMGWLIKVNENGEKEWEKIFGGKSDDCFLSVHQTNDGGFILAGYTKSFGAGDADIWLLKLDKDGEKEWENIWGGAGFDKANDIWQTTDGSYVTIFYYESFGFNIDDDWLYKLNIAGIKEWQKTFGGMYKDVLYQVRETDDGNYIIIGSTESFGSGKADVWLIKTNDEGNALWNKTYGGKGNDHGYCVEQTDDGYVMVGSTESFGSGGSDGWIIKTDEEGNLEWDATFGGERNDSFTSLQKTDDGYIIAGSTESFGSGGSDGWVIKIVANEPPSPPNVSGSTTGFQWVKYTYNVSSIDPDGDRIRFYFDWGDGSFNWTNFVDSGKTISQSHIWKDAGTYELKIKSQDENGGESNWHIMQISISSNSKPDKPDKPEGPASGIPSKEYTYSTLTYDADGDMIKYGWDWNGDRIVDEWTSFHPSGEIVEIQHSWNEQGDYEVRVISKDEHGAKSEWSDPLDISIPCLLKKFMNLPLISFLKDVLIPFIFYMLH